MGFEFRPRAISAHASSLAKTFEVYIGVDFGTTYSKVAFQVGDRQGATKYSLRFYHEDDEEDYCIPSVLGCSKDGRLVFTQEPEDSGLIPVKYFKYSMIEKGVPRNDRLGSVRTANDPQRLCSAFYLAHLLRMARRNIMSHRSLARAAAGAEIRWYVNMGAPVNDFNAKPKPVYDEALNVAWKLSEMTNLPLEIGVEDLDKLYSQWIDPSVWDKRLNTVPELYAEIIMFLQDKSVDTGFYSVIDIGGGTIDMAVFFKRINAFTKHVEISCVAQDVCPLGYEIYRRRTEDSTPRKLLKTSYGGLVDVAYWSHRHDMEKAKRHGVPLVHFYLGGARDVRFYHSCINEMIKIHGGTWSCYPGAAQGDIFKFAGGRSYFEVNGNSRILISQMLAQPYEKMPELSGQPWHFQPDAIRITAPSPEDLYIEKYGY